MAKTLLLSGHVADARKIVDQVVTVATETHSRELELSATLTAARVRAASGDSSEAREALRSLDRVIADATTTGFQAITLEARLAKGEIEMGNPDPSTGRTELDALRKEAAKGGFQLFAQKASAALQTATNRGSHDVRD